MSMNKINEILGMAKLRPKYIRLGQYLFNECYKIYPDETDELRGTEFDCFYDNSKVDIFLEKLKEKIL